jgi:O-antigen/teichoic acid export membrane protein
VDDEIRPVTERLPAPDLALGRFTSGRALARNTVLSFVGLAAPLPIALLTLPLLTSRLGNDRFGILALILALIGYSSVLDLGLGRVLTQVVAQKLGAGQDQEVPLIVWTTLLLLAALGIVGTVTIGLVAPWFVRELLRIPESLQAESRQALLLLALALPFITTSSGLRGVLEAQQRFGVVSAVSIAMSCFILAGPVLVLPFSRSIVTIVAVIFMGRLVAWAVYFVFCLRITPGLMKKVKPELTLLGPILRFGGWLTVSNIISPMLTYLDRFLIGSIVSVGAVAYYTVPYDMVARVSVISVALTSVLFPAFAASFEQDRERTAKMFGWGAKTLVLILAPVTLMIFMFAEEGLQIWLGADYADNSTIVLQWLAVGIFINSMAQMPFALIQAAGRPDLTAKLHVCELLPFLALLFWLVGAHGIAGAAMAWTTRVTVDTLCLLWLARRFVPQSTVLISQLAVAVGVALLVGTQIPITATIGVRSLILLTALVVLAPTLWYLLLTPAERHLIEHYFESIRSTVVERASARIRGFGSIRNR